MSGEVPNQLASHTTVIHNNHMLLYGGTATPFGTTTSTKVFSMNLRAKKWEVLETTVEEDDDTPEVRR